MDIKELDYEELEQYLLSIGEKQFRTKQLFLWIHARRIRQFSDAHNIGQRLTGILKEKFKLQMPELVERFVSIDGTEKYLMRLGDGELIESVLMRYRGDFSKQRNTLCVSSQVGCAMGCAFCATGHQGFTRSLTVSEILGQIYLANDILGQHESGQEIRNIVFMGMGEPFNNFDAVLKSCRILCHPMGMNLSPRRITISTCGVVPRIREFADLDTDLELAISLHATNNSDRDVLMPVNQRYPLTELIDSCVYYQEKTGKRISFEYALIKDVNDTEKQVRELTHLLHPLDCHVNVIPVNSVNHGSFTKPNKRDVEAFIDALRKNGVGASVRQEKGADIDGACGQLKTRYTKSS